MSLFSYNNSFESEEKDVMLPRFIELYSIFAGVQMAGALSPTGDAIWKTIAVMVQMKLIAPRQQNQDAEVW